MTTDQHTSPAMARALAAIAALDHEPARMRERMRHDRRMKWLEDTILSLAAPEPADGYHGGIQIMLEMTSSRHWRQLRAKALKFAREHQIMGHPGAARMWLSKAKEHRKEELSYGCFEASARNLEAVDRACAAMAEPLSQKVA